MKEEKKYERVSGTVKFYAHAKGFGFIKRPNKEDVFFSTKSLEDSGITNVRENDEVEFDLVPVKGKGGRAINILLFQRKNNGPRRAN